VAKHVEKIQRDFLWLDKICAPYPNGGLAVRNFKLFNETLLGKWLWRFRVEREAFWRQVVMTKYGSLEGGWTSRLADGPYGVSLWKYICLGWDEFSCLIKFEVWDGTKVRK
jgi:hypothetical protein